MGFFYLDWSLHFLELKKLALHLDYCDTHPWAQDPSGVSVPPAVATRWHPWRAEGARTRSPSTVAESPTQG